MLLETQLSRACEDCDNGDVPNSKVSISKSKQLWSSQFVQSGNNTTSWQSPNMFVGDSE